MPVHQHAPWDGEMKSSHYVLCCYMSDRLTFSMAVCSDEHHPVFTLKEDVSLLRVAFVTTEYLSCSTADFRPTCLPITWRKWTSWSRIRPSALSLPPSASTTLFSPGTVSQRYHAFVLNIDVTVVMLWQCSVTVSLKSFFSNLQTIITSHICLLVSFPQGTEYKANCTSEYFLSNTVGESYLKTLYFPFHLPHHVPLCIWSLILVL